MRLYLRRQQVTIANYRQSIPDVVIQFGDTSHVFIHFLPPRTARSDDNAEQHHREKSDYTRVYESVESNRAPELADEGVSNIFENCNDDAAYDNDGEGHSLRFEEARYFEYSWST